MKDHHLLELEFIDGRKAVLPGPVLPKGQDLVALATKYLDLSKRGVAFPGLAKVTVRAATAEEMRAFRLQHKQGVEQLRQLGGPVEIPE